MRLKSSKLHQTDTWKRMLLLNFESCSSEPFAGNIDHSGDGNMVHQIDALSMIEIYPERSSEKNAQAEAETTELEDWIGELMGRYTSKEFEAILNEDVQQIPEEDDQQRPSISALSQSSAPPPRLGDKSLPIELDDDEDEELIQDPAKLFFSQPEDLPLHGVTDEA
ncbi:unnamed protein product [Thlaspi arvense]|uniref:Uncharacterized protein n=1 Tax=Thlaspi arvense TaxID=13288 RepID=A0AAU9SR65_THLAR|nr:unnamed protein product [Thlaspi arvense]